MRQVTKEEFYAAIGPLDVHPRVERGEILWETPGRRLIGRSTPGYLCTGPKAYYLAIE